jgi:hypothetical protein
MASDRFFELCETNRWDDAKHAAHEGVSKTNPLRNWNILHYACARRDLQLISLALSTSEDLTSLLSYEDKVS